MALAFHFNSTSYTPAQYDGVISELEAIGAGAPAGRLYHVALENSGQIHVFDVWESQEALEAFGLTVFPVMEALGADAGKPQVSRVRNIIKG